MDTSKEKYRAIQDSLFNRGDLAPIAYFDSRRYIQHNPLLQDGLNSILGFIDGMRGTPVSVRVCRVIEDGAYTFAHNDYELGTWGRVIAFDVARWEDGRIVEHWDNVQPTPAQPNASGRTMTDGAAEVGDLDRTEANKAVVERFTRDVLIDGGRDLGGFFAGDALIQHSPAYGDGVPAFRQHLDRSGAGYERLHKVLGEGDFVLATSEGWTMDGDVRKATGFYDLYRLQAGVIAEHWEVVEIVPPRDRWVNGNGRF